MALHSVCGSFSGSFRVCTEDIGRSFAEHPKHVCLSLPFYKFSENCARLIPIQRICKGDLNSITDEAKDLFPKYFKDEEPKTVTGQFFFSHSLESFSKVEITLSRSEMNASPRWLNS